MTANTMPTFRRGGQGAEEAEKAARDAARGRNKGADYFSLKNDGDETVVRLLTEHDDWIWVGQHSFVPTKAAPKDAENWPETMTGVCRHDVGFDGIYKDCYVCDNKIKNKWGKVAKPNVRVWALAVERELVRGDGTEALGGPSKKGVVIGVRDKVDEVDEVDAEGEPTGNTLRYPRIIIINQPMKGFFGSLKALYGLYGTVCDRDFVVRRQGTGTDTEYRITALDPLADLKPGTPQYEAYLQAAAEREISLEQIVADKASDAYFARFFDPAKDVDKDGNIIASGTVRLPAPAAETGAYSADLKDRIRNLGQPKAS